MSFDCDVFQIAFMVDLQSYKKNLENELACQKVANQIRLSALKILTHFCQAFSQSKIKTSLRWGYTFYNSCSLATSNVRSDFKEFNLKNFDIFENDVEDKLENERAMEEGSIAKGGRCHSEAIKYGLMDLSNEFPWGRPEIMSPVRSTRQKKTQQKTQTWKNISFVFSHCPHSKVDIENFMYGKRSSEPEGNDESNSVVKAKDVLNRITTQSLLREICDSKRIRIFWVDLSTGANTEIGPGFQQIISAGLQLFNDVLQDFSGRVLPLGAILQLGSPTLNQFLPKLRCEQEEKKSAPPHLDPLLPFSSISNHMVANATIATVNKVEDNKPGACLVFLTGNNKKEVFYLDTQSLVNQGETLNHRLCGKSMSVKAPTVVIAVSGTLDRGALPLDYLSDTDVYLCTPSKRQSEDPLFHCLLAEISKQNLSLIVDFTSVVRNTCWKAILQPLTAVSATLTIIKPDHILFVEKLLSSKLITESSQEGLDSFVERTVSHLLKGVSTPQFQENQPSDVDFAKSNERKDNMMLSSILEPWFLQGCRQATMYSMMESLKEGSVGPGGEELKTIRKLQELYRCANNPDVTQKNQVKAEKHQKETVDEHKDDGLKLLKSAKDMSGRTAAIFEKSRKITMERQKSDNSPTKEEKKKRTLQTRPQCDRSIQGGIDFKDEDDLVNHLQENYQKVLTRNLDAVNYARMVFTIVSHYYKEGGNANPQESTVSLLNSKLLINSKALKERFKENGTEGEDQVTEFQAQIILHMECESFKAEGTEVVNMAQVQTISKLISSMGVASSDASVVPKFLQHVVIEPYGPTIPMTLANVYEELMQPLPESLPNLFSPSSQSDDEKQCQSVQSVRSASSVRSESLFSEDSSDPWSVRTRSRKVSRYSSVGDMASSRQIMMPVPHQRSQRRRSGKRSKKEKLPRASSSSLVPIMVAETVEKKKEVDTDDDPTDVKKVRRNLFMGALSSGADRLLERRQSIAVMENVGGSNESPHKKKVLKTQTVAETPERKLALKTLRSKEKMDKLAKRMSMQSEVMVVEESPEKPFQGLRKSPRRLSLAPVLTRKRSFYSDHPSKKSRNVEKYRTVASEFKSPDKVITEHAKNILFSQFGSPSPGKNLPDSMKVTPRRSTRLFSPEKDAETFAQKLTPQRASGVKKQLLGFMHESPMKTFEKSPDMFDSPMKSAQYDAASTPKKTPSKQLIVPDSCSKTPQRVFWSEPIELGPHTPRKTPEKPESILSGKKKSPGHLSPDTYFTRTKTPSKDHSQSLDGVREPRRDLFGLESSRDPKDKPTTPGKCVVFGTEFITTPKKTFEFGSVQSPRTPRSILKSKTVSLSSPGTVVLSPREKSTRFAKRLCLDLLGSDDEKASHSGAVRKNCTTSITTVPIGVGDTNLKDNLIKTPVGANSKLRNPVSPQLFGDDWGKTTPDKFQSINLDSILPLLGNSPVVMNVKTGDVTPERLLTVSADITPKAKPPIKTPDSFDKWKRTKRRNSVQRSPVTEPPLGGICKLDTASSENSDENLSPKLNRKVRKRNRLQNSHELEYNSSVLEPQEQINCESKQSVASPHVDSLDSVVILTPRHKTVKNALTTEKTCEDFDSNGNDSEKLNSRKRKSGCQPASTVEKQESPIVHATDLSPECLFTPQRFTRGLSKEIGLSPQVFTTMSTKSPKKKQVSVSVGATDKLKGSGKRKRGTEKAGELAKDLTVKAVTLSKESDIAKQEFGTPTKRRRVLQAGGQSIGVSSCEESPGSYLPSISSQVSCPDYFSSENEEVFLSNDQEQFRYIDETTCGFASDNSFSQKSSGTPSGHLLQSLSLSGVQTSITHHGVGAYHSEGASNHSAHSMGRRSLRSSCLQHHSSGSMLSEGSRPSQQDEESLEALSIMSENLQSPRKSLFQHQKLVTEAVPLSPSHHRVEALRKVNWVIRSPTHSNPSPSVDKINSPQLSVAEISDSEKDSPKSSGSIPKKFSPNITARALSHLLQSPILKSHDSECFNLGDQNYKLDKVEPSEEDTKQETKRSSRRSLYRTKTKSVI